MNLRRIGVHTSIAGGIHLSIERAKRLGCNTVQIFTHSPRSWLVRRPAIEEITQFKRLRALYDISPVYIHTSYLINLASQNKDVAEKSVNLLKIEMELADSFEADYVVLHPGSAHDYEDGFNRVIKNMKKALKDKYRAKILIENTAGQRGDLTSTISEIARLIYSIDNSAIGGVCIDTCHAFQAGYEISCESGINKLINELKWLIGIERLKLLHINDSKRPYHSRIDRHEHIGLGAIGKTGFLMLLNDSALINIPIILETPKSSDDDDRRNLKVLRRLLKG